MEGKRKKKEKIHSFIGNATHQNLYSKSRGSNRPTLPCNHVRIEKQGQQSHVFPIKRRLSAPSSSFFSLSDTNLAASTNAKQHLEMTTSKRVAERRVARFQKNISRRGSVESSTKKAYGYPVGPILLGFFVFVVVGSSLFQIIRIATSKGKGMA
ncbi:hypothetical protein QUC31_013308 [Theobroma cacao]